MADRVIIAGVTRGGGRIPISELKQMIGRAGRSHDDSTALVEIVIDESEMDVKDDIESPESVQVNSVLHNTDEMLFHILPEICSAKVRNEETARQWYRRSFSAYQKRKVDFKHVFEMLQEVEAVRWDGRYVTSTRMGEISSSLYFHPCDVACWKDNFSYLFQLGLEVEDIAVAWALGNVRHLRASGSFGRYWEVVDEFRNNMPVGLDVVDGAISTMVLWWHITGGPPVGPMKNQALALREEFGRIRKALEWLDVRVAKWGMVDFFDELEFRVRKALPSELVSLCKIEGVTKNKAACLYNMGARDVDSARQVLGIDNDDDIKEALQEMDDLS